MAVKGFNVGGNIHQYDVNSLANITEVTDRLDDLEADVSTLNTGYAKFGVHTFTGTTTSSGALAIPSAYNGGKAIIFGVHYTESATGLVYQRDANYFTCMLQGTSTGTYVYPNASASVTVTFGYWMQT